VRINLSAIQSIRPPASLFGEFFEKSVHFSGAMYPEGNFVEVDIVWDKENKYQDKEPALAVKLDNATIGYVPCVRTIEAYVKEAGSKMKAAIASGDVARAKYWMDREKFHSDRKPFAVIFRDQVETELFRNHEPVVKAKLARVQVSDETGEVMSISVDIDEY